MAGVLIFLSARRRAVAGRCYNGPPGRMLKLLSRHPWTIATASLCLLSAVLCYGAYRVCLLGKFSFREVTTGLAAYTGREANPRVAVLRGEYTARFFGSAGTLDAHAAYWRELLPSLNIPCDLISDAQLEEGLNPYQVLVLPSAVCLSEREKQNIRAFLKGGKGVVCTWAVGTRDEQGNWSGWNFLQELTGADSFQSPQRDPPWLISFANGSPVTVGAPSGSRIQVDSPERLEAKALTADAYWSDAHLSPVDPALPPNFLGAVIHQPLGPGRVVWFGFQENSAIEGRDNKVILDSALTNAVVWAGQRVLAAVEPWPRGHSDAVVLALDVEQDYENASYAADAFLKDQTKGTFFCATNTVRQDRDLVQLLQRAGELASHGNTHQDFSGPWVLPQFFRLESSRWTLWRLGKTWAGGFHAPEDVANPRTIRALAGAGFRYYLASGEGHNSVLPVILEVSQSLATFHRELRLVRLSRMTDDDLHFSPLGIGGLEPRWIVERVLSDFDIVSGLGGLYVLAFHTQGLSAPEYSGVLSQLIEKWKNRATWVATGQEVAEWWAKRSQLSVWVFENAPGVLRLWIVYEGDKPIEGVVLTIYPPTGAYQGQIVSVEGGIAPPQITPDPPKGRIRLSFEKFEPGGAYAYDFKLSP